MLAEVAILQTIIICVRTTWAYQVQDNWNLNTTIANHLDQSLWSPIGNRDKQLDHIYYTPLAYAQLCCTFYQPRQTIKICRNKTIFLSQTQTLPHGPITMTRQSNPNHTSFLTLLKSNIILCIFSTPNSPASAAAAGPTLKQNYDSPFNLPQFSYMSQ